MLQCDYWVLGTFCLLSPSIAIFMTLYRQICEFPDNSAVKGGWEGTLSLNYHPHINTHILTHIQSIPTIIMSSIKGH